MNAPSSSKRSLLEPLVPNPKRARYDDTDYGALDSPSSRPRPRPRPSPKQIDNTFDVYEADQDDKDIDIKPESFNQAIEEEEELLSSNYMNNADDEAKEHILYKNSYDDITTTMANESHHVHNALNTVQLFVNIGRNKLENNYPLLSYSEIIGINKTWSDSEENEGEDDNNRCHQIDLTLPSSNTNLEDV